MSAALLQATTARLRPKNQITVPEVALAAVGARVGTRFVVSVENGSIHLHPVLPSYAGTLDKVYGSDWADDLRRERDAWGR